MKKRGWIAGLAALMLLSGCGAFPEEGSGVTETLLGEPFSTRWFDCAAEEAESRKSYEGYTAASGNKLVVVELELTPTYRAAPQRGTARRTGTDSRCPHRTRPQCAGSARPR